MKRMSVIFIVCSMILSPLNIYGAEVNDPQAAVVEVAPETLPSETDLDESEEETTSSAATSSAIEEDVTDFQQSVLDKLDVIIYLLAVISAAGIFYLISLIARLFGWIVANIFKVVFISMVVIFVFSLISIMFIQIVIVICMGN